MRIREINVDAYDKSILQLSLAGLALLVAFYGKIAILPDPISMGFLVTTLICLGLAPILIVLGFIFSKKNMDLKINDLNSRFDQMQDTGKFIDEKFFVVKKWAEQTSQISFYVFILAIVCFVTFSIRSANYTPIQPIVQEALMPADKDKKDSRRDSLTERIKDFSEGKGLTEVGEARPNREPKPQKDDKQKE